MPVTAEKKTKEQVNYGAGNSREKCSLCEHFRTPASCTKVVGYISPDAWCRLFRKKAA